MQTLEVFVGRQTLPDDAPDYFDPEVCVLAAAVIINILNQVSMCFILKRLTLL